jgi:hypothetical protein
MCWSIRAPAAPTAPASARRLLPRKLVVVFTPNRQSLEGVQALVTRATAYRRSHEDEQRPLLVYPLPSRIEMGDSTQRAQWRRGDSQLRILGYQPIFERLMRECYGMQQISLDSYFDEVQLQQTRTFAYGEQLAVRIDQGGDRFSLTRTFEAFLDWLGPGYFPWQSSREIHLLTSIGEARQALGEGGVRALSQPMARELNLLGELYRREGKLRQAMACFEESLSLRQRGMGEDHPDTLQSQSNLAGVLRLQGQLDDAQFLEECIVESRERLLGAEHLDTLAARANLAATLAQQGRSAEALAMQDKVLDAYLRLLGSEHLLTLSCQAARADLLFQRGDAEQARIAQEQVLAARKRLLGAEHADTLAQQDRAGLHFGAAAGARRRAQPVRERAAGADPAPRPRPSGHPQGARIPGRRPPAARRAARRVAAGAGTASGRGDG